MCIISRYEGCSYSNRTSRTAIIIWLGQRLSQGCMHCRPVNLFIQENTISSIFGLYHLEQWWQDTCWIHLCTRSTLCCQDGRRTPWTVSPFAFVSHTQERGHDGAGKGKHGINYNHFWCMPVKESHVYRHACSVYTQLDCSCHILQIGIYYILYAPSRQG